MTWEEHKVSVPEGTSGDWSIRKLVLEPEDPGLLIHNLRSLFQPGDRSIPPGSYTQLHHRQRGVVMSDTPTEIREHRDILSRLRRTHPARVLIAGLGIGMTLQAALRNPAVEHIDVVELESDVLNLVAPHYNDPRVNYVPNDIFGCKWPPHTHWDLAWFDIWDDLCTDNLTEMAKLHRSYARRAGWYGSWGHPELQSQRRKETRYAWW
jgi:hypothetical protein